MVRKARTKQPSEPVPAPQAGPTRKRQTSNADEMQNKRAKIDNDEESNEGSKKNKGKKGTKKKGKQPWYVAASPLFNFLNLFWQENGCTESCPGCCS
jgi:hypothetical protein